MTFFPAIGNTVITTHKIPVFSRKEDGESALLDFIQDQGGETLTKEQVVKDTNILVQSSNFKAVA